MPMAGTSRSVGMESAISAERTPRSDGRTNPIDTTRALARGARLGGARIVENTAVTGIRVRDGAVAGVATTRGGVACEVVVNCGGQWGKAIGRLCGVTVPLHSAEHYYVVTKPIAGVHPDLPVMRDPDGYIYCKEEVGGLVVGGFEPDAKPWGMDGIPENFEFQLLPDDWDQFQILMENALLRIPDLEKTEIRKFYNGPESFTPDNQTIARAAAIWRPLAETQETLARDGLAFLRNLSRGVE